MSSSPEKQEQENDSSTFDKDKFQLINSDFKSHYMVILQEIEESDDFDQVLPTLEETMTVISKEKDTKNPLLTKEHTDYFLNEGLPQILRELLQKRHMDIQRNQFQMVDRLRNFFLFCTEFIIPYIASDGPFQLMDTLRRLLDEDRSFYSQTSTLTIQNEPPEDEKVTFVSMKKKDIVRGGMMYQARISPFFVQIVNKFGQKGGFDAIIARIRYHQPKLAIPRLKSFVSIFFQLRDLMISSKKDLLVPELQQSVFDLLLGLNDDELRPLEKTDFEEIVRNLEALLEKTSSFEKSVHELMETFCLQFAYKCFKSSILDKRLNGLTYIEDVIDYAITREKLQYSSSSTIMNSPLHSHVDDYHMHTAHSYSYFKQTKWVDVKYMIQWIIEKGILEELFEINPHIALLSKCGKIITFMATKDALSVQYLEIMWNAMKNKHESITKATQEVISESIQHLGSQHLEFLMKKLKTTPPHEMDNRNVLLLVDLGKNQEPKIRNEAFDFLWSIASDENSSVIRPEIQSLALEKLSKLLDHWSNKSRKSDLAAMFVSTIQSGQSVIPALKLLRDLIDTNTDKDSKKIMLLKLEADFSLTELLFKDYAIYKHNASQTLSKIQSQQSTIIDTVLSGVHTHYTQIKARLDFLRFIVDSGHHLSQAHVDTVWNLSVVNAFTLEEEDLAYDWFIKLIQDGSHWQADVIAYLLQTKLFNLPVEKITTIAFKCFSKYFVAVNKHQGNLNQQEEVLDFGFTGMDKLWLIVLHTSNQNVLKDSVDLLIKVHQKVSKEHKDKKSQGSEMYIANCMTYLTSALAKKDTQTINRSIFLLKTFLDMSSAPIGVPQHDRGAPIVLKIINTIPDTMPEQMKIRMHQHDSVSILRQKLSQQLNLSPESIIMLGDNGTTELSDDKTFDEVNIADSAEITLKKYTAPTVPDTPNQAPKLKPPTEDELAKATQVMEVIGVPQAAAIIALQKCVWNIDEAVTKLLIDDVFKQHILEESLKYAPLITPQQDKSEVSSNEVSPSLLLSSSPAHFNLLFDLLNLENVDRQSVWRILMKLPTNENIAQRIRQIKDVIKSKREMDWDSVLDSRHSGIYKLLYSLQIVHQLMVPEDSEDSELERLDWCKNFLYGGGFNHIFKILISMLDQTDASEQSTFFQSDAWRACLALLLTIINAFIKGKPNITYLTIVLGDSSIISSSLASQNKELLRHSGETLRKSIDFPSFIHKMIKLIWNITRYDDVDAISPAMSLLVASLLSGNDLLVCFYNFLQVKEFVLHVLMKAPQPTIRREAQLGFYQLCSLTNIPPGSKVVHPHVFFLRLLLDNLPTDMLQSTTCEQYFDLLNKLIKDACAGKEGGSPKDFLSLLDSVINAIKMRPIIERSRSDTEDKVLIGLLSIVHTLVSQEPSLRVLVGSPKHHNLVQELYHNCLFATPTEEHHARGIHPTKCVTHPSRNAALLLLAELARDCPENFAETVRLLKSHHVILERELSSWDNPKVHEKSASGYVGLKNLGATCYVNSLMQQFYMIPSFRNSILSLQLFNMSDRSDKDDDNLLKHIQLMFAYLYSSERQYFNPTGFCKAFKDWEGNSINTSLQQDVLEFYNILCDHLEKLFKGTPYNTLLDNSLIGTLSQEFICKDCPHYSESTEPFYTISVDIKGKNNLEEALESYVKGEVLEGESAYLCEQCKKKVRALKRASIKKLSPTLVVHLKRFEYVIERQTNNKLSDYFEFPMKINMEPYTKEGIEKKEGKLPTTHPSDYYQYELVGVLVHSGHADSGHYYSFIRERTPSDSKTNKWFRFDDTTVSPFNINNLKEECFGGTQITTYSGFSGAQFSREQPKLKNAYMLLYERVHTTTESDASKQIALPQSLEARLREENYQLMRDRQLFDQEYFQFMYTLLSSVQFPPQLDYNINIDPLAAAQPSYFNQYLDAAFETIQLGTFFVIETVLRAREEHLVVPWMKVLSRLYSNHVPACKWLLKLLLKERRNWFRFLLIECYDDYVRIGFQEILTIAIKCLSPLEYSFYFEVDEEIDIESLSNSSPQSDSPLTIQVPRPVSVRFIANCISLCEFTRQHWRKFKQYFTLLRDFALIGPYERFYLVRSNLAYTLLDYYMGPYSFALKPTQQRIKIGDQNQAPDLKEFMELLSIVIRSHATDAMLRHNSKRIPATAFSDTLERVPLPESCKKMLFHKDLFISLLKQAYHPESVKEITAHWIWEDAEKSLWIIDILIDLLCKTNWNGCFDLLSTFEAVLGIQDSLEHWRIDQALNMKHSGLLFICKNLRDKYPKFVQMCVKFMLKWIYQFPMVASYCYNHRNDLLKWLEPWIRTRVALTNDVDLGSSLSDLRALQDGVFKTQHEEDYRSLWSADRARIVKIQLVQQQQTLVQQILPEYH